MKAKRSSFRGENYDWVFDLVLLPVALITGVISIFNWGRK